MEIINNKTVERTVKTIANNILPSCDELFFEVGYFYFSGFEQIYEQLKNKKIKIKRVAVQIETINGPISNVVTNKVIAEIPTAK